MRWRHGICIAIALAATAHADDTAAAKQLYDVGLRHYNVAEYADAITSWKQAYLIAKKPILLFNIGQAYRLSGDCAQAMTFYDSYAREAPNPPNQEELDQAIALCKAAKPAEPEPHPEPTPPPPPVPTPVVEPPPAPAPKPEPPPAPVERAHSHTRTIAIVVGAAGIAASATGVYFALAGKHDSQKLDGFTGPWTPTQQAIQTTGQRDNKLAWVFGGVGAAAVITGAVMFVLGGASEQPIAIAPTRGGAQVAWSFAW
jgi:hypothetical protein